MTTADSTAAAADGVRGDERPAASAGRRVLRWAIGIAIAFFVLAGAGVWNAHRVADETIASHRARAKQEATELAARPRGRPALLEPAVAGDASAVIDRFLAAVAAVPRAERDLLDPTFVGSSTTAAAPDDVDRVLAAHPDPVAALEPILHVPSTVALSRLDDLGETSAKKLPGVQSGSRWLLAAATRAVERGDRAEVARLVPLQLALGREVERSGLFIDRLVGMAIAYTAWTPLRDALAAGLVDAAAARTLGRAIDGLDAARPPLVDTCDAERTVARFVLAERDGGTEIFVGSNEKIAAGWRHLWSSKLARSSALLDFDDTNGRIRALVAALDAGTIDAGKARDEAQRLADGSDNEYLRLVLAVWPIVIRREANQAAAWRVARVALAVAAYVADKGAPPASIADLVPAYLGRVPLDPWDGKPLRYAAGKVWSIGEDQIDDGGTPYADPDDMSGKGDVVLQVGIGK